MAYPLSALNYAHEQFRLDTRLLVSIRSFAERTLAGLGDDDCAAILLALDEAVANAIAHARAPAEAVLDLVVYRERDHVRLILTNPGQPFEGDPVPVDLEAHRAEFRTSGLGLFLMRQLMDRVWFRTTREGEQQVVLIKQVA